MHNDCLLCRAEREVVFWRHEHCRVIHVGEPDYPGFCRVVWNAHVREMSDLRQAERDGLMAVVHATEQVLRDALKPDKINLASLGNQVPHLRCARTHKCRGSPLWGGENRTQDAGSDHWHVIPRFVDDAHFPGSVWGTRCRVGAPRAIDAASLAVGLRERLGP